MLSRITGLLIVLTILAFTFAACMAKLVGAKHAKQVLAQRCFQSILWLMHVQVEVVGEATPLRPLLLVTNHSSYIDIPILGAALPVVFTPKAEIAGWPLIGFICRLIDSVFIDRRVSRTAENQQALRSALRDGSIISLFPEGTTSDSKRVLPFRSSFFSLAEERFDGHALYVQPAAITYTRVGGLPIDTVLRPKVAWYGDMELVPHVSELLKLGRISAKLTFLPVVTVDQFENRKALAAHCEKVIAEVMQER